MVADHGDRARHGVSIVIPVLDEERSLDGCLAALAGQQPPFEVIVVDGGSRDATRRIARASGATLRRTPPGRAQQMNAGAGAAAGTILLFLHADSRLPPEGLRRVRGAVEAGAEGGAFAMRYDSGRLDLRFAGWVANLYCRATGDLFGDRAMFVTRDAFHRLGGFRPMRLMEDLDFSLRMRRRGCRVALLPGPVVTSPRRLARLGVWRGGWWAWRLTRAFHRGARHEAAAERFYRAVVR